MTARLQVLEAVVVNEGITWGVDDLDRRRNLVRESCTIGGESDHTPSRWPDVLRLTWSAVDLPWLVRSRL